MQSDEELMLRYCQGDREAFRELFDRYAGMLLRLLSRELRDPALAEDLVQQTFLQLHRARFDFDPTRSFKPWVLTIALNLERGAKRSRHRRPEVSGGLEAESVGQPGDQGRVEARQSVSWAMEYLSAEQREVIELHWYEGLSFPEVARRLGIGAVAAKVRAHRGYSRLRALLTGNRQTGGDV
ncbi:MAG TPA: RNA polymerase sigma factor [Polyangiaceae bacterium]